MNPRELNAYCSDIHPDCSAVTDAMLTSTIKGAWPVTNGVASIPYSYSSIPYWFTLLPLISKLLTPRSLSGGFENIVKDRISAHFTKWSEASNGLLKFFESNSINPFAKGIYIFLPGNVDVIKQAAPDAIAFAVRRFDNNGNLFQAYIFLPDDERFWNQNGYSIFQGESMRSHEMGHALGFNHLHESPVIKKILSETENGIFCSIMPYAKEISTPTSQCDPCLPGLPRYATCPSELDKRMIKIAYQDGLNSELSSEKIGSYLLNASQVTIFSIFSAASHEGISAFFSNIAIYPDKPLISKKRSQFIADAALFTTIVYLEFPVWTVALFGATAATKFLPNCVFDKIPEKVKKVVTSRYSLYAFNFSIAYLQGQKFLPWLVTSLGSTGGTELGKSIGKIGKYAAWGCNKISQAITARLCPRAPRATSIQLPEIDLEAALYGHDHSPISKNPSGLFSFHENPSDLSTYKRAPTASRG